MAARRLSESGGSLEGPGSGRTCHESSMYLEDSVYSRFPLFSDPSLCPSFRT